MIIRKKMMINGAKVRVTQGWMQQSHLTALAALDKATKAVHDFDAAVSAIVSKQTRQKVEAASATARGALSTLVHREVWEALDDQKAPLLVMYSDSSETINDDEEADDDIEAVMNGG